MPRAKKTAPNLVFKRQPVDDEKRQHPSDSEDHHLPLANSFKMVSATHAHRQSTRKRPLRSHSHAQFRSSEGTWKRHLGPVTIEDHHHQHHHPQSRHTMIADDYFFLRYTGPLRRPGDSGRKERPRAGLLPACQLQEHP